MSICRNVPDICRPGKIVTYQYDPETFRVTQEMKQVFDWDGCFLVKGLFDTKEIEKINYALDVNPAFIEKAFEVADGKGRSSRLSLWSHPGSDVTGMVGRCEKIVGTCEELLGGAEVYHYHTKLLMKMPRTGGSHLWHQDYGYWYKNGLLRPDVITAYIAVDKCVKENGCLQVVIGTHRCGRIDHDLVAGQTVANQERVDQLLKDHELVYAEMDSGDTLFFHSNLLHTAEKNDSDMRRWTFLCSYNRKDNNPVFAHHHPQYTPLHKVPNSAIMDCTNYTDLSGKDFMNPSDDKTIRGKQTGYH